MNRLALASAIVGLLANAASAQTVACKPAAAQEQGQAACQRKAAPNVGAQTRGIPAMTPADKEILDRAHTRTLLENIEGQARRLR